LRNCPQDDQGVEAEEGSLVIELRQFKQFIAVAEELSFRRAAERLHMAQPPLTTTIKRIEDEIGTTLIERTNRIARLTEAGRVFLDEARRTVSQAERAILAARRAGAGLTGTLRITFVASAAREILPSILLRFREHYPEVKLELREAMTAEQVAALLNDESDLGFVIPPLREAGSLNLEVVVRNRLVAAVPDGHPLAKSARIALSDLAQESWISFTARQGPGLYELIQSACRKAGFSPRIGQEAPQMDTITNLVAGGMGVALVSRALVGGGREGVAFRELVGPGTPVEYELAIAYGSPSPILDAFVAAVRLQSKILAP
jgi:DNA-binding transcriptional LysR family regulator